ncbi:MAG: helix-turn-helix transcriptional regulator [Phycicoccus sp.]
MPDRVEALCRLGRTDDARQVAEPFLRFAARKGQPWSLARAARVRGLVEADDAEPHLTAALEQHARTLDVFEAARTRLVLGEWLRRSRRRVDARAHLSAALVTFDRLDAPAWAERARAELAATGLTVHRRVTGPVVELTAREHQVALLLAEGRTTREAAAALFLSPKTVEHHLRHVYAKLGIGSRAELGPALADDGGEDTDDTG